jgi:arginyl-tRNA synthetase
MNRIETIQASLQDFLQKTYALTDAQTASIAIQLNTDTNKQQFGDISTNAALILAKSLKQPPQDIAYTISEQFHHQDIASIEIAKPAFVNLTLTDDATNVLARNIFTHKSTFFKPISPAKNRYSVEFVSANPTGPLHFGHGRGGIIGDVLVRVLQFLDHDATSEYYINDAGNQIYHLGQSLHIRVRQALGDDTIKIPESGYHGSYLQDLAHQAIAEHGQEILHYTNQFFATYAKEHLLDQIKDTLHEYGISFDVWFSEATLHQDDKVKAAVTRLEDTGHMYEDDGALWFASTTFGDDKDRVIRRKNGEFTYAAADIAYLINKIERGFDTIIIILGQDHHSYVQRLKGIMEALGYDPNRLYVILYQLVTIKSAEVQGRMSKRAGTMTTLHDIINLVGRDVARFFYLNKKADAHLDFDVDLALKHTDENPVFYIQYAYVRTISIQEKAKQHGELLHDITENDCDIANTTERTLLKKVIRLKSLLEQIGTQYQTHLLAHYAYDLASSFHKYYGSQRVIDKNNLLQSRSRLALVAIMQDTLGLCLQLLGLHQPYKM